MLKKRGKEEKNRKKRRGGEKERRREKGGEKEIEIRWLFMHVYPSLSFLSFLL